MVEAAAAAKALEDEAIEYAAGSLLVEAGSNAGMAAPPSSRSSSKRACRRRQQDPAHEGGAR